MTRATAAIKGAFVLGALCVGAIAPAQRTSRPAWVVGVLCAVTCNDDNVRSFRAGLRELGYVEGANVVVEMREARGRIERLPGLATELVTQHADAILASGGIEAAQAAKAALPAVPVVFVIAGDPVAAGLVASYARPGGNATGLSSANAELEAKRLGLLKEAVPGIVRAAIICHAGDSTSEDQLDAAYGAGAALGLQLQRLQVGSPGEFDGAIAQAMRVGAQAVTVLAEPTFYPSHERVVRLLDRYRLPAIAPWRHWAEAGALISYGPNIPQLHRRGAALVDKVLHGARPGDIPVEQPSVFELVVNQHTAHKLGIKIPQSLLLRADEVIE